VTKNLLVFLTFCLLMPISWPAIAQSSVSSLPIQANERSALFPTDNTIEQGKALAAAGCAGCHGIDGLSTNEMRPHLAGQRVIYLYREMMAYKDGGRENPEMRSAVAFLDDDALLKTATYYASLSTPFDRDANAIAEDARNHLNDDPMLAVKAATAGCGSCHGVNGNSSIPGMPSLSSQHPDYFVAAMKAYQSGERTDNMMQMLTATLDEKLIDKMGLYYALQEPAGITLSAPGDSEAGKLVANTCGSCHGSDGNTLATEMPSIAGQDPVYFVKALKAYTNGQRKHTAMESAVSSLAERDFADLAAFYTTQQPVARRVPKPLTARQWIDRCDRCHGKAGNSTDPRYSRLSGQQRNYLVKVLQDYANGQRSDSIMHAMSEPLDKGLIEKIAAYYSAQEPRLAVYFQLPCNEGKDQ
jgi:cytochrome c553